MRVLLKLSGEALAGEQGAGVEPAAVAELVTEIAAFVDAGGSLGVVIGGGNLIRGAALAATGVERITADHMGMLATVINGLAFGAALSHAGVANQVFSSIGIPGVAAGYSRDTAVAALERGAVGVFAGGTGNPLFTTDTAACLRAIEIGADRVLKATKVDGVYSADPLLDSAAERFDSLTFDEVLTRDLRVLDTAAIALCRDHALPLTVFDMRAPGALTRILRGEKVGTAVGTGVG